jgi:hypothetical protein
MELRKRIALLTADSIYRHALFYNYPDGLRFKLSEGGHPLDQVLVALRKATTICADIFNSDDVMLVHLQKFAPPSRYQLRSTLRELDLAGITIPPTRDIWLEKDEEDSWGENGDGGCWINMAFELPPAKLQNLLWCALVGDFGPLHPNPHCLVYLVNLKKEIIVHPYDDRGMDVIGGNSSSLRDLYKKHNDWLLGYDMEAMNTTFSPQ